MTPLLHPHLTPFTPFTPPHHRWSSSPAMLRAPIRACTWWSRCPHFHTSHPHTVHTSTPQVVVVTSDVAGAGSDSRVHMVMISEDGTESGRLALDQAGQVWTVSSKA
jgi:hypothetical protein